MLSWSSSFHGAAIRRRRLRVPFYVHFMFDIFIITGCLFCFTVLVCSLCCTANVRLSCYFSSVLPFFIVLGTCIGFSLVQVCNLDYEHATFPVDSVHCQFVLMSCSMVFGSGSCLCFVHAATYKGETADARGRGGGGGGCGGLGGGGGGAGAGGWTLPEAGDPRARWSGPRT